MDRLIPLFLAIVLLTAPACCPTCTRSDPQEKPQDQEVLQPYQPKPAATPSRYRVVFRNRSALRDPAFVSIERRGEYVLEEVNHSRSWIWEGRDSLQPFWKRP